MPPAREVAPEFAFLKALEGALREGQLLHEALGGVLEAALRLFDASAVALLPKGGSPALTRAGRSIVAAAAEQRLGRHLEDVLSQNRELRAVDSGLVFFGAPIRGNDVTSGAFGVAFGQARGPETDEAARVLAQILSHVLERSRTVPALSKRREEAMALFELASLALHSVETDEVIQKTVASLVRELDFEEVHAFVLDAETREVEEVYRHGPPKSGTFSGRARQPVAADELLTRCLKSGAPTFEDEPGSGGSFRPHKKRLALPLVAGEAVLGFLVAARRGAFALTAPEMRLAQELARLAAGTLERARLLAAENRSAQRVDLVTHLHASLAGLLDLEAILQRATSEIAMRLDLDLCVVRVLSQGGLAGATGLYARAGAGPPKGDEISDALFARLSREHSHVAFTDASSEPEGLALIPAPSLVKNLPRPLSFVAVPLSYRGETVGALVGVTGGRSTPFSSLLLSLLSAVAVELSLAVTSARLLQRERESNRFLERLRAVGRSLSTTFDTARIQHILCEETVSLLGADTGQFWALAPKATALQVSARWGAEGGSELGTSVPLSDSAHPVVRVFQESIQTPASDTDTAVLFSHTGSGPPLEKALLAAIVHQNERLGVLVIGFRRGTATAVSGTMDRFSLLADAGALALHNARVMKLLEQQSERDGQTGLYNRASILRRLESEMRRAERSGQPIAVAHIRMDGLSETSQRFGASVLEALLPKAASQLVRATRAVNVVGRDRQDRFWILIFDATKAQALRAVETMQKNFDGALDPRLEQAGLKLTLTVGLTAYPEDAFDTASLVQRAEEALDDAVKAGPGRIALYGALSEADSLSVL